MKKYAACALFWLLLLFPAGCGQESGSVSGGPTLPGADEIYPTVMAGDALYAWRTGAAILDALPESAVYSGGITHIDGTEPAGDGEFVSVFDAEGDIYVDPEEDACIYLLLTTDWMEDTAVIFDRLPD